MSHETLERTHRRGFRLGISLVALFVLAACSKVKRDFDRFRDSDDGGDGNGGEGSGTGGTNTGGTGNGGEGGGIEPVPCEGNTDPDCECVDGQLEGRDIDGDGRRTRLCEASPGFDCDDGDPDFVENECGGCNKDLGSLEVDQACQDCGVARCQGDSAIICASPNPAPKQCADGNTPQVCMSGDWANQTDCTGSLPVCLSGNCVQCAPGTFLCTGGQAVPCTANGSWESSGTSCDSLQTCTTNSGCTGLLLHPRDSAFEVPLLAPSFPELRDGSAGRSVRDWLDGPTGFEFG